MHDTALEICNNFLKIDYGEYNELSDDKRNKVDLKYDPKKHKELTDKEESVDLSDMSPLGGDEVMKKK